MKKNINDFYKFLASNEDLKKKISLNQFIKVGEKLDKEKLKKIISTEIIPVAKKNGFDLTTEEILNKELASQRTLTEENLADVSGGVKPKTAGIILSLLTVGTGVMSSATNLAAFAAEKAGTSKAPIVQEVENLDLTDTSKEQEAPQDNGLPNPPPPPVPAPPPPPPPGAPAPVVSSNVSIPQGFSKIDMPETNEEIKKLIKIDLPENFEEIKEKCILLKDGEDILLYKTDTQELWTEENESNKWSILHLYNLRKGMKLKKTHIKTQEEKDQEREKREEEEIQQQLYVNTLPILTRNKIREGKAEVYRNKDGTFGFKYVEEMKKEYIDSLPNSDEIRKKIGEGNAEVYRKKDGTFAIRDLGRKKEFISKLPEEVRKKIEEKKAVVYEKEDGTFEVKELRDFSKKAKLDVSNIDGVQAGHLFRDRAFEMEEHVKVISDLAAKTKKVGLNAENTEEAKKMISKINQSLKDCETISNKLSEVYKEEKAKGEKTAFLRNTNLDPLKKAYNDIIKYRQYIVNIYVGTFRLDVESLGLEKQPDNIFPVPRELKLNNGLNVTYNYEENTITFGGNEGEERVICFELLRDLNVSFSDIYTHKKVKIKLNKDCKLDKLASRILKTGYNKDDGYFIELKRDAPPLEKVYETMKQGDEALEQLLVDFKAESNISVAYTAVPIVQKTSVKEQVDTKNQLPWQKDQNDNLTAKKGRSTVTYNVSTGLFEVKGSAVVLEQEDINSIESIIGKKLEKIEYKVKGKIILGQTLLNSGWVNSTGYFFGNYSYSRISDNVKLTSVENVAMYKYKDGAVYIIDNRDDKSEPIILNEDDLNKVETEFGSTRIYSKFKVELKTNSNNWTKNNSWRYYGFEKR